MRNEVTRGNATGRIVLVFAMSLFVPAESMPATGSCRQVLSVREVVRNARQLDGEVVCVRGIIVQQEITDRRAVTALAPEMMQLVDGNTASRQRATVGLIDWDRETGVDGRSYRPETFARLEQLVGTGAQPNGPRSVDATVRGAVMHKRRLLERSREIAKRTAGIDITGPQREVELVLLEVITVQGPAPPLPVPLRRR